MLRRLGGGVAIAAWWLALLGVFCELPVRAPLRPAERMSLPGSAFDEKLGRSHSLDDEVTIDAPGRDFAALQVRSGERIEAARWRILHFRFSHLPRTLELSFVFRRADRPDDVQVVPLPWPTDGAADFDLRRAPEWRGDIVEIGFNEIPTGALSPPSLSFRPFALDEMELQGPSWQGALAVKASDWFGYWPWALMSISALGPDAAAARGQSLVLMLSLGGAGMLLISYLALGWRGRRLMHACFAVALGVWLALDLRWLANLYERVSGTRQVYAGRTWEERQALVPDPKLYAAAERVRLQLADAPRNLKLFVAAATDYERARLIYHLLPLNAAPVNLTGLGTPVQRRGAYVLVYGETNATGADLRREDAGLRDAAGHVYAVESVLDEGDVHLYRFVDGGGA